MRCPNCGGAVAELDGRCPACRAPLPASVATGLLTPIPDEVATVLRSGPVVAPAPEEGGPTIAADTTGLPVSAFPGAARDGMATQPPGGALPLDTTGLPASAGGIRQAPAPTGPTGPLQIGQQFSPRYIIVRLLGIGGMGAVYQAWDAELSVMVALKVVRPEVTRDPAAAREIERRFKQELLLARQVTHKNVVRIHDMGEIDGIKYITMPYIEGEDLATVLKRTGPMPVASVMPVARQVAAGLLAAHQAGVVHRDLKPANIMLEKDHEAIIMDFGIARTTSPAPRTVAPGAPVQLGAIVDEEMTRAAATMAGAVVGTIEYMAPEQARGQDVDQRTDIYAFGLILYDMLVGRRRAGHAESAIAELQKRLTESPPRLSLVVPGVPAALDQLVARCIEADAARRYASTADLVAAIDRLDDNGKLRPIRRVVGLPLMAATVVLLLGLSGGIWWYTRPPVQHDPVAVVIADLANLTGDSTFDGTLEPIMRRALEEAGFITAYDRSGIRALGARPRDSLDEEAARTLAVEQGLGVVLSGSIERQGNGYRVSVRATQTVTGSEITTEQARATSKENVLEVATRLMTRVRSALGDDESESAQQFAMASLSATSFDVVRLYAAAMQASAAGQSEEARSNALRAVEVDPNFGIGYVILANQSANLGRSEDERKYIELALQHLDGMTERERYHARGSSYLATNDYQQCVKEYTDAITKYPADIAGHNQLALCLSHLRQFPRAVQVMQEVVKILPNQPVFRINLSLYSSYAGDFKTAEQEARAVDTPNVYALLGLAFAQLGQGQLSQARSTYETLARVSRRGLSIAAAGLGDLAALEGRFSDAVRLLREAVPGDLAEGDLDAAAAKLTAVASAELARGRPAAAVEAAEEALMHSTDVRTRFLAARTFAEAGDGTRAKPLVDSLANELYDEPRAYAKIVDGVLALKGGDARRATIALREANQLFDTWIGQFDLGRASLAAGLFPQADSAFDACLNARRGEALAVFVDEQPSYAYLAPVHYYLGRARQELKSPRYTESYREYLTLRGRSTEDPLLKDIRTRAGQ